MALALLTFIKWCQCWNRVLKKLLSIDFFFFLLLLRAHSVAKQLTSLRPCEPEPQKGWGDALLPLLKVTGSLRVGRMRLVSPKTSTPFCHSGSVDMGYKTPR